MRPSMTAFLAAIRFSLRTRAELEIEILLCATNSPSSSRLRHDGSGSVEPTDFSGCCSRACGVAGGGPCRSCNLRPSSHGIAACSPGIGAGVPRTPSGSPSDPGRRSRAHPQDASRESHLGCPTPSRRTPEVGHRDRRDHRRQVSRPATRVALADVGCCCRTAS